MNFFYLQLDNKQCTVEIFAFKKYRDLETRVRGHSRSLEMTTFDKTHTTSYSA